MIGVAVSAGAVSWAGEPHPLRMKIIAKANGMILFI